MTAPKAPPAPVQVHDPRKLAKGERWTYTCLMCQLVTQGGRGGLAAHQRVVHGVSWGKVR